MRYAILVPMAGGEREFRLCLCESVLAVAEVLSILLKNGVEGPPYIKVEVIRD